MTAHAVCAARRRYPCGAEVQDAGVHFRVWAPVRKRVEVVFEPPTSSAVGPCELIGEDEGYFAGVVEQARPGMRYRFRLDGRQELLFPDPASRFQPEGPFGPSQSGVPGSFSWTDWDWAGITLPMQVL